MRWRSFIPQRIADRILGMGDIVTLVEKAAATIDAEKAARVAEKMRKGQFDLADLREQLTQMQQMGGMAGLMGMLPGIAKMKNQLAAANLDERVLKRQMAMIDSMTPKERRNPDVLKASRKKRIAAGSGTKVEDVNRLLKMHRSMADMMKMMSSGPKRGPMAGLANMLGLGSGMPSPEQMAELAKKMPGGMPAGMPGAPGLPPGMPGGRACPACRNCRAPAVRCCRASAASRRAWAASRDSGRRNEQRWHRRHAEHLCASIPGAPCRRGASTRESESLRHDVHYSIRRARIARLCPRMTNREIVTKGKTECP